MKTSGLFRWDDDTGSAVAEFSLVSGMLTLLTLSVIQLGLGLLVRNTVMDAAAAGARTAAFADTTAADGASRTRALISTAVGEDYGRYVTVRHVSWHGRPCVEVRVVTVLPLIGLIGMPEGMEVTGHAVRETIR